MITFKPTITLLFAFFPPLSLWLSFVSSVYAAKALWTSVHWWLCGCRCCHLLMSPVMMWGCFSLKWRHRARTQSFHLSKTKCDSDNCEPAKREKRRCFRLQIISLTPLKWWHASGNCSVKLPVWGMKGESASCQLLTSIWERSVGVWTSCCCRRCCRVW